MIHAGYCGLHHGALRLARPQPGHVDRRCSVGMCIQPRRGLSRDMSIDDVLWGRRSFDRRPIQISNVDQVWSPSGFKGTKLFRTDGGPDLNIPQKSGNPKLFESLGRMWSRSQHPQILCPDHSPMVGWSWPISKDHCVWAHLCPVQTETCPQRHHPISRTSRPTPLCPGMSLRQAWGCAVCLEQAHGPMVVVVVGLSPGPCGTADITRRNGEMDKATNQSQTCNVACLPCRSLGLCRSVWSPTVQPAPPPLPCNTCWHPGRPSSSVSHCHCRPGAPTRPVHYNPPLQRRLRLIHGDLCLLMHTCVLPHTLLHA